MEGPVRWRYGRYGIPKAVAEREKVIAEWLERIRRSKLGLSEFFAQNAVPFSPVQYYRYRAAYDRGGTAALKDGRSAGNHRRLDAEAEGFLAGYAAAHPRASRGEICEAIRERFGIEMSESGIGRALGRLGIERAERPRGGGSARHAVQYAGFELVVALAWHFGWPQWTAKVIGEALERARASGAFASEPIPDTKGRNPSGQFTARYNRRRDVREERFQSVGSKRAYRCLERMDIAKVDADTLARKCLAVLALPFLSLNGQIRTVNTAPGMALGELCGFPYRQATLSRFLAELKYLGLSGDLLRAQVGFWRGIWQDVAPLEENLPLLCYYVDGNTKALWSRQRVKKHKVTMLGRVMGCLEQVFVHDGHGRPIYFETYSGQAPLGEYVLGLFEKIEDSLEGPGPKLPVTRAIVMDAAHNSVRTLRAFAAQGKYHYITSLDANQWNPRRVRKQGHPERYRWGDATLWDAELELEDSRPEEKGYIFVTRAVRIEWDNGKETYLATSLPREVVGPSLVVRSYFARWPAEELSFKLLKAVGSLHRVAGYGKQRLEDLRARKRAAELEAQIQELRARLAEPLAAMGDLEWEVAGLVLRERRLRARSQVVDGERILPPKEAEKFERLGQRIRALRREVRAIRKAHPEFRKLDRAETEWIRLREKDSVYRVDVELDQILTYFRVSLANLYTYLAHLAGWSHLSLVRLLHTVLLLPGTVEETRESRRVILERNPREPETMDAVSSAIERLNALGITNGRGQKISFALGV